MLFKNRDFFPLNRREKIFREILRVLLILIFSIILKGIINQNNHKDQDYILVPVLATLGEIFCVIYIFNSFTTGNIVRRWANDSILTIVFNFIKSNWGTTDEKTMELTTKVFGVFIIIVFFATILAEIDFYFW